MKKIYSVVFGIFFLLSGIKAQGQQFIKYQAEARDVVGKVVSNQHINVRISIHNNSITGNVIYRENDTATTNAFGLFELAIGKGTVTMGSFVAINWQNEAKYLQVEINPAGSSAYLNMGTSQLLSVPYALNAGSKMGNTPYWNGNKWVINSSNIYYDGENIGIGIDTPRAKLSAIGTLDFRRVGSDGQTYYLTMSDTVPTVTKSKIPHLMMLAGPPIGLHSVVSLESINMCCGQDSLTVVVGVLDNSGPLHHTISITQNSFYLRSKEKDLTSGEYHISAAGISMLYQDRSTSTEWMLSNKIGKPGQVLTLNPTADTASWKNIDNFANVFYYAPLNDASINVLAGLNIIEPAAPLNALNIHLPLTPADKATVAFSFVKAVSTISFSGSSVANAINTAAAGSNVRYIYYAKNNKWYSW